MSKRLWEPTLYNLDKKGLSSLDSPFTIILLLLTKRNFFHFIFIQPFDDFHN